MKYFLFFLFIEKENNNNNQLAKEIMGKVEEMFTKMQLYPVGMC